LLISAKFLENELKQFSPKNEMKLFRSCPFKFQTSGDKTSSSQTGWNDATPPEKNVSEKDGERKRENR
jgi:hypothetical protein